MKTQLDGQFSLFGTEVKRISYVEAPLTKPVKSSCYKRRNIYVVLGTHNTMTCLAYSDRQARFLFHKKYGSEFIEEVWYEGLEGEN